MRKDRYALLPTFVVIRLNPRSARVPQQMCGADAMSNGQWLPLGAVKVGGIRPEVGNHEASESLNGMAQEVSAEGKSGKQMHFGHNGIMGEGIGENKRQGRADPGRAWEGIAQGHKAVASECECRIGWLTMQMGSNDLYVDSNTSPWYYKAQVRRIKARMSTPCANRRLFSAAPSLPQRTKKPAEVPVKEASRSTTQRSQQKSYSNSQASIHHPSL
ncbi:hypothetical protein CBR_g12329 [Chara braunii]|uniref:Uncharacterized protein n=1 Tax=Chara braunii TaxID=69332 RepID=A0A388KRR9_CHABU|nr:hypothetical protein CBR_g12329 [Chara braunii]|eukprot:GBG72761.1 hypothetical protein CBR_g12329 [Chara braunii]